MPTATALLKDALELSVADRVALASALLQSVSEAADDLTAAQKKELRRRQAELKRNPRLGVPWEQVKAKLCGREA